MLVLCIGQAYDLYKQRDMENGWESSLTAKAGMTVSSLPRLYVLLYIYIYVCVCVSRSL